MIASVRRLFASLFPALLAGVAQAATYSLPAGIGSGPFANCSLSSGTSYACTGDVTIGNNDTVNFTGPMTLLVGDDFTMNNNSTLNGNGHLVTIQAADDIILGNSFAGSINFVAGDDFTAGNSAVVTGDITAGDDVQIGNGGTVTGNVTAGDELNLGAGTTVSGTCSPSNSSCLGSNLLAEYRFDECAWTSGAGSAVTDSAGSYHGTPYGVSTASGGVVQRAADLSAAGTGDYIHWPSALLHGRTNFTVSLWFKTAVSQAQQEILHGLGSSAADDEIEIYLVNSTQVRVNLLDAGDTYTSGVSFVDGNWHHLAVTRSGGSVCVYLDATSLGCNNRGTNALSITNANALLSGQEQDAYGGSFADNQSLRAQLDEFKVFGSALSGAQIAGIRSNELAGKNWDGTERAESCLPYCFTDSFTGTDGSSPSSDWTTSSSSGTFGQPKIYGNRLRLTNASSNVATAAHLQRMFPGAGNKISVEFDYFAYNGSGADGIALTFSDASVTPQAGAYGGSLGYAQRCGVDGFAGGWLGIGIDEYGNFRNDEECRGDGGTPNGRVQDSVAVRGSGSGTSGYLLHAQSGTLSPGVDQAGATAGPNHRYRVTVDHSDGAHAYVKVERDSGTGYATIIPQYDAKAQSGQSTVPINWMLSYTGSTGGSTNIHEIDNLSVCTSQPILPLGGVHHLRIEHAGGGVTCAPSTLTVKACADAACATLYTGGVSGTLTATGAPTVNWVGGAGFSIDASGSTTKQVQVTTAGTVTWGTTAEVPAASNATDCYVGATASCSHVSALAGFLFDIPHHAADVVQNVVVSAVKQADNTLACIPAFASVAKTVNFTCAYGDPASGTLPVNVGGTDIACGGAGGVGLNFNASGQATTTVRYADVGQMSLTATYAGSGDEAGLTMTGSDSFIAAPASFAVVPSGPYVAGTPFSVTVTAKNASGATTPNFGKESSTENVNLTSSLTGPAGGNNPALEGSTTLADAAFQSGGGAASAHDIEWDEVGDIDVVATLAGGSYLGSGLAATGSGAAGPFRPAYFETEVVLGTGAFSYSGQAFEVTVTAKNADGGTTLNYEGAYAKAVTLSDANSATNNSATLGGFTNNTVAAASFADGEATANNVTYTFAAKQTAPLEAPASAPLALRATDSDGVTSSGHAEGQTPLRAGRLRLINAYGSELLPPRVEYRAEYWDGNHWATNVLDSATAIAAGNIATGGLTVGSVGALANGVGFVTFTTAGAGSYDIAINLNASGADTSCNTVHGGTPANLPWLQGHWSGACGGTPAWAQDPSARIRLGSPKAPHIYLRERY